MIIFIIEIIIVIFGLLSSVLLFFHFPKLLNKKSSFETFPGVSVIIPARNEERNLELLLSDLLKQSIRPLEIICVDDASEDHTASVAQKYGVRLISVQNKPDDWIGKTWACQCGAKASSGELFLFLDADVRLSRNGIFKLLSANAAYGSTISVQPYHRTETNYEQLSLIFNLVQIAANGTALPRPNPLGLYGPVILISRTDYNAVGGHNVVKSSIVEDVALGIQLKKSGLPYRVFVGDHDIAFRMYENGLKSLLEGWTKNLASGAEKTPPQILLLVVLWIASLISVPLHMFAALLNADLVQASFFGVLYVVWAVVLSILSKKIGLFRSWTTLVFPIPLFTFFGVFALSAIKKALHMKVRWKDREIPLETK